MMMSSKPYSDPQCFNMSHSLGIRLTHWKSLKQPVNYLDLTAMIQ